MSLFIEGLIFPLGMLNLNDWGVPFSEEGNATATAKTAVVRVCSRMDPHFCDMVGDPLSEIGGAVDSWIQGDGENKEVHARAEIRDSVAAQKIEDNVWKPNWSVFINYQSIDASGWVHGIEVESITLVNDPAWPAASWKVVSASNGTKKQLKLTASYNIVSAAGEPITHKKTVGDFIPKTIEELEAENAALKAENDTLKGKGPTEGNDPGPGEGNPGGEGGEGDGPGPGEGNPGGEGGTGGTGEAALIEENRRLKTQMATMITKDEAKALISEGIANDRKAEAARKDREEAYKEFAAVRESLGKKTDPKDFATFGASELRTFTADLVELKTAAASKGSGFTFTSTGGGMKGGSTVGRWDSKKQDYVNSN